MGVRSTDEMEYDRRKAELQSADLKRYGIQTIWVDDYAEVPQLLRALESYVTRKGVFVSGAAHEPGLLGWDQLNELSRALGAEIIKRGFNLVSGFGIGIAEQTILGAFRAVYESAKPQPAERVLIRPFPGTAPPERRVEIFRRHREDLISQVGALVVIAGNKVSSDGSVVLSVGVEEEVQIALRLGKPVIPVGVTGNVAQAVWEAAHKAPGRYLPGIDSKAELDMLGNSTATVQEIVQAVSSLLFKAEQIASARCRDNPKSV